MVKLLIQPQDGIAPLLAAIKKAKKKIDLVVFRFDRAEIEAALTAAVRRGVAVSALIAYANRGGEKQLRKLEMRLLDAGVKVSDPGHAGALSQQDDGRRRPGAVRAVVQLHTPGH